MKETVAWENDTVVLLDQTKLPQEESYVVCDTYPVVVQAIRTMVVRGAPAIGVAAAMGIALGALHLTASSGETFIQQFEVICDEFARTRPTASNLFWAIQRMRRLVAVHSHEGIETLKQLLRREAIAIAEEDVCCNRQMGQVGKGLIRDGATVLTHCNAGALATVGYGTALGVIRAAHEEGKQVRVMACETRPLLQGARLTAWELKESSIPVTVITDNMAGYAMRKGYISCVLTGADCICANGDVVNKIGTYSLAVLAHEHSIPFYVAAPLSTLELNRRRGHEVPIEERDAREVTHIGEKNILPVGVGVWNPAFDVTPAKYVSAIITERGMVTKPYRRSLSALNRSSARGGG